MPTLPLSSRPAPVGLHGQHIDWIRPDRMLYHLGHGARSYDPVALRFLTPDPLSPFSAGGINPYAFCGNDPVNGSDPSGFVSARQKGALALGILSILLSLLTFGAMALPLTGMAFALAATSMTMGVGSGVASVVSASLANSDPGLSGIFGWIAFGLGIGAVLAGQGSTIATRLVRPGPLSATSGVVMREGGGSTIRIGKMTLVVDDAVDTINAHGAPFTTQTTTPVSGRTLANQLATVTGGSAHPYKPLRIAACYSATGGRYASQAQVVANRLGRNTIGYHGRVNAMSLGETVSGNTRRTLFTPQTGSMAIRTQVLNDIGSALLRPAIFLRNPGAFL